MFNWFYSLLRNTDFELVQVRLSMTDCWRWFSNGAGLMSVSSSAAGLQILYTLLQNVSAEEAAAQSFYQTYFCDVLQHIFSVVTDTSHTAGKETDLVASGCTKIYCHQSTK